MRTYKHFISILHKIAEFPADSKSKFFIHINGFGVVLQNFEKVLPDAILFKKWQRMFKNLRCQPSASEFFQSSCAGVVGCFYAVKKAGSIKSERHQLFIFKCTKRQLRIKSPPLEHHA